LANPIPSGGDSFACRYYHAGLAASAGPNPHCSHAGPSGGALCGNYCQAYCNAMMGLCGAVGQTTDGYSSSYSTCLSLCGAIPTVAGTVLYTSNGAAANDDIMCRLYHGANNGLLAPVPHCSHGSLSGGGVCGGFCSVYCRMLPQYCGSSIPPALTGGACNTWCNSYYNNTKIGAVGDTTGDTINCRIHYLIQANTSAATANSCPSAIGAAGSSCPLPLAPPPPTTSGAPPTTGSSPPKSPPATSGSAPPTSGSAPPTSGSAPPTSGTTTPPPASSNATTLFASLAVVVATLAVALF